MKALIIVLLLTGCSVPLERMTGLDPEQCRNLGVNVADGSIPTGTVVSSEFKWIGTGALAEACGGDWGMDACTVGVTEPWKDPDGQYRIYYADPHLAYHEYCHGAYEVRAHQSEWVVAVIQGQRTVPRGNTVYQMVEK